jgi:hypothetical protein
MSARELAEWIAFEKVFGPLTVQERIDGMAAEVTWAALTAGGHKSKIDDWIPNWSGAKPEQDPDLMIGFMRGLQRRGRKKRKRGDSGTDERPDPRNRSG